MNLSQIITTTLALLDVTPEDAEDALAETLAKALVEHLGNLEQDEAGEVLRVLRNPRAVRFVALVARKALEQQ